MDSHTSVGTLGCNGRGLRDTALGLFVSGVLSSLMLLAFAASGASASTRSALELPPLEYLSYGPSAGEVANVYPAATPSSPLVVLVHGGGWRKQGPLGRLELEAHALQREGSTVVEINYDQDTAWTPAFPLEPQEVVAATRWAIANAVGFGADPHRVVLIGGSAGGNLVALAAETLDAQAPGTVDGVVTLSAPTNFPTLVPALGADTLNNENFTKSVHQALGMREESVLSGFPSTIANEGSPAQHVSPGGCPSWLIFNSEAEFVPLEQARMLYGNLRASGCSATLVTMPGREHSFAYFHLVKPSIFSFIRSL